MTVQSFDIVITMVRHGLKVFPAVQQKKRAVLDQIHIAGILRFPDLEAENISVEAYHPCHVVDKQSKTVQSHLTPPKIYIS